MRRALFLTAYNRVAYLQNALHTWHDVRGLENWHVVFMVEPSPVQQQVREEFEEFVYHRGLTDYEIWENPIRYGVLSAPFVGFNRLFGRLHSPFDFVVRAEDDLLVSSDILEYFEWASEYFDEDDSIGSVQGWSMNEGDDEEVRTDQPFSPLTWGTWRDRWRKHMAPTWDHDYSTHNGTPGQEAGWDWNLNTRVYPENGLTAVAPVNSRVQNIGVWGSHATPENFIESPSFQQLREATQYATV